MEIIFNVSELTVGDIVLTERDYKRYTAMTEVLSKYMVDKDGKPIKQDKAKEILFNLKDSELPEVIKQFRKTVSGTAIPNQSDSA